jgi:hypothetical protein
MACGLNILCFFPPNRSRLIGPRFQVRAICPLRRQALQFQQPSIATVLRKQLGLQYVTMVGSTMPETAWCISYASEQRLALSSLRNTEQKLVFIIDGL